MASGFLTFLTIYGPTLIAVLFLIGLVKVRGGTGKTAVILKPFGDFVDFKIHLTGFFIIRTLLFLGFLSSMFSYFLLDYSALFPSDLRMEVFFDDPGLERSLAAFSKEEIENFHVPSDFAPYRKQYFQQLDSEVRKVTGTKTFFSMSSSTLHSTGRTNFIVEKINGFQNYHIIESRGELSHILEMPNIHRVEFFTLFEKMNSKDDYLSPNFVDLCIKRSFILRPVFKQLLAQDRNSEGVPFRFTVVGVTKLYFFPWPKLSNTVYFANFGSAGLVPVAYAIYH